jgi:hypothetical protein
MRGPDHECFVWREREFQALLEKRFQQVASLSHGFDNFLGAFVTYPERGIIYMDGQRDRHECAHQP